ncbi:MAG: sulfotransferase [Promethearchaeota archaeon]
MKFDRNGENLFFLISQPRAGSTLLQMMLFGNPEIATTSEPWIALYPIFSFKFDAPELPFSANRAKEALFDFLENSGLDLHYFKSHISAFLLNLYEQSTAYQKKKYFLDKTPRYYHIIDELFELFPKAKSIILFRNPLAVFSSILQTWANSDISLLANYIDDLFTAPKKLVISVKKYPERCIPVQYENLVTNPQLTMKTLCQFLGITYSDTMLEYGSRVKPNWKFGDQKGIRDAKRPNRESLSKWKSDLKHSPENILALTYLEALGPKLLKEMGYDYQEIYLSIKLPDDYESHHPWSWSIYEKILSIFTNVKDLKRLAFITLLQEKILIDNKIIELRAWEKIEKSILKSLKQPALIQINSDLKRLELERNHLANRVDAMENTVSWKITAPLRDSKLLKKIMNLFTDKKTTKKLFFK